MPRIQLLHALPSVLLLGLGCEPLLDLDHDYAMRADGTGGIGSVASSSGTSATLLVAAGGVTAPNPGGGGAAGAATGGSVASSGVATGGATTGAIGTGAGGTGGSSSTRSSTGGIAAGGTSATRSTTGGVATGGTFSTRATTGGVATGGTSSTRATTGGVATGGRASSGGVASGGTSATRVNTGGVTSAGAASGGAGTGGGSNCTACSHAIALQSETATPEHGSNTASGTTYTSYDDRCPSNQVLIGYAGTLRDDVHTVNDVPVLQLASLVAICGTITLGATGAITVTPSSGITARGTDGTAGTLAQLCPTDQIVVGFAGRSGTIIDQIGFVCASLADVASACCCTALSIGDTYAFTPVGGTGGTAYSESCPKGQVALGQSLYTATTTKHVGEEWVSRFGLLCGTPMPQTACGT